MILGKILFTYFLATAALLTSSEVFATVVAAKVVSVAGDVLVRNESPDAPRMRKLQLGEDVLQGDVINTASGSTTKLLFSDRSVMDLGGSTLFKVDEYDIRGGADRKVAMTMSYGKVRAAVNTPVGPKGKFNIRTKTATMGVRGTEFIIASDIAETAPPSSQNASRSAAPSAQVRTQITVVEGKVEVADNSAPKKPAVAVKQGEQLTTVSEVVNDRTVRKPASSDAPKVVELSAAEIKSVVQEVKLEDKTFRKAVAVEPVAGSNTPSTGMSTIAEIGASLAKTPEFNPTAGQIGTPGTFGFSINPIQNALPQGSPINLKVVFKK